MRRTEDCRITFSTSHLLLRSVTPIGFLWNYQGDDLQLCLTFDEDMDTAVTPPAANFIIDVDTVDKTPDSVQWLNNRVLQLLYEEAALGPVAVSLEYTDCNETLRAADGVPVFQFNISGIHQNPSAKWEADLPEVTIDIELVLNLESDAGTPTDIWEISWVAVTKEPDAVNVQLDGDILLTINPSGQPVEPVNVELLVVNEFLKTAAGLWICPFKLLDIEESG